MAPFHRTLFSKNGIEVMMRSVGLNVVRWLPSGYVWGWSRGMSWKLGLEKEYRELRKDKNFVKLDFAIDTLLEDISRNCKNGR